MKMVFGFENKLYKKRLTLLVLTTIQRRRERDDLIMTFKIFTHRENVNKGDFFQLAN